MHSEEGRDRRGLREGRGTRAVSGGIQWRREESVLIHSLRLAGFFSSTIQKGAVSSHVPEGFIPGQNQAAGEIKPGGKGFLYIVLKNAQGALQNVPATHACSIPGNVSFEFVR